MDKNIEAYKFIENLKQLPFVDGVWLFGSRARGDNTDRSDIDLAIVCPNATSYDWSKVLGVIDNADTLLKIDCIRFDELAENDPLRDNILRFKKIIYER
jgi:predicted nucleotidyltransferase